MFKQGDKATARSGSVVEVQFGPFSGVKGEECYLVKWLGGPMTGRSFVSSSDDLTPAPKFQVGQKVTFTYSPYGEDFEIVAGPFPAEEGKPLYVLKDRYGVHDTSYEHYMVPVVE